MAGPQGPEPILVTYRQSPPRLTVVPFAHPGQDRSADTAHIAVPVSLNGGPPRAFLLDTGAPVTVVLVSKQLLAVPAVAQRMEVAAPVHIRGISGASSTAYRVTARSIGVGSSRIGPFPYVLMSADRDLSSLGETPYGPVVGILGNDFLSRFRVTVDYQGGTVSLEDR